MYGYFSDETLIWPRKAAINYRSPVFSSEVDGHAIKEAFVYQVSIKICYTGPHVNFAQFYFQTFYFLSNR